MLTPEEIQSREFLVSLRGYDRDEVHAFLDEVAEAFAQLRAQAGVAPASAAEPAPATTPEPAPEPAQAPAPAPAPAVSPFAAIGAETQRILEAAQQAGEEIRARAAAEAEVARSEAVAGAQGEVASLREQAAATQSQLDVLLQRRDELADRLRQARETLDLALLEVEDADVDPEPADPRTSVLAAVADDGDEELDDEPGTATGGTPDLLSALDAEDEGAEDAVDAADEDEVDDEDD